MRRVFAAVVLVVPLVMAGTRSSPVSAQTGTQVTGPRGTVTGQAPAGTAVLRGTVVSADTGTPLRRVLVRAQAAEAQDIKAATTDDQGRFEIRELTGGRYTITAQKTGYVTLSYGQRRVGERGTVVAVPAGQTVEKIALALPRGGVITGRVSDEFGEPLAEASVQVQRYRYMPGGRRLMPMGRPDTTDDQGTFRLYGLEPGDYVVSATLRNASGMMMIGGRPAPDSDQGYAPTYFRHTVAAGRAADQRRPVREVSGIAFALTPTRVVRISGRVTGGPRAPADGSLMVRPEEGFTGGMLPGGMVQADGTFEIAGVPPGRYVLQVQPRQRGDNDLIGVTSVTVSGADLQNLTIAMQRPGSVSGRFEFEGGPPADLNPTMVRFMPMPADPGSSRFMMTSPPQTNPDYSFRGQGFLGLVLLRASAPPGWYLASIHHGADDVTDVPVRLEPGTDVRDLRILFTRTATTLSGTVRDDRGNPVVDATAWSSRTTTRVDLRLAASADAASGYPRPLRDARPAPASTTASSRCRDWKTARLRS
jgi:hypothetical protein